MPDFKIVINFNNENLGKATNVWYFQITGIIPPDSSILFDAEEWMEAVYGPLLPSMSQGYNFMDGTVYEVNASGEIIRIVGAIAPDIDGTNAAQGLALPTAGSGTARTNVSRVRGGKRFGGIVEPEQADGLFINAFLSVLAEAVLQWLIGPSGPVGSPYVSGVMSSKVGGFVPFNDTGIATNIPGTQVTRKPGRGA